MHGKDPRLPEVLRELLTDVTVLTVWAWGGADFVTFATALGLDIAHLMVLAAMAGRLSDVAVREALYWCAAPAWGAWWGIRPPEVAGSKKPREVSLADAFAGDGSDTEDWTRPKLGLEPTIFRWRGRALGKDDGTRLGYGPLVDLPLEAWPERSREYALDDAEATLDAWLAQDTGEVGVLAGDDPRLTGASPIVRYQRRMAARRMLRLRRLLGVAARQYGAPERLLGNERERVCMLLAQAWTEEHASLYVDGEYLARISAAYRGAADRCAEALRTAGLIKPDGKLSQTEQKRRAHALFDALGKVQPTWGPSLTDKGKEEARWLQGRPWHEWTAEQVPFASCGGKIIAEAASLLEADVRICKLLGNPSAAALGCMETGGFAELDYALAHAREPWAVAFVVYQRSKAYLSNFLDPLAEYAREGRPIRPRLALMLITGRISLAGAIRQNEPRKGGIRECFIPPPGRAIFLRDFSQIELVCLGWLTSRITEQMRKYAPDSYTSELARVINAGKDAHIILALDFLEEKPSLLNALTEWARAQPGWVEGDEWALHDAAKRLRSLTEDTKKADRAALPGVPWDAGEALCAARQDAKSCNYGFGGGMGPATFIATQRKTGNLTWTLPKAANAAKRWRARWRDMGLYEDFCAQIVKGPNALVHPISGRLRSGLTQTACANVWFQGQAADMFVRAYFRAWYESVFGCVCDLTPAAVAERSRVVVSDILNRALAGLRYSEAVRLAWLRPGEEPSPLAGCTVVLPIHDEIVATCPLDYVTFATRKGRAHAQAAADGRLSEIMLEAAAHYLPGMLVETSGAVLAHPDPTTGAAVGERWRKV